MPVVNIPVNIFVDDTSGNKSKKWNPYHLWTLQVAGIPSELKQQKNRMHHLTTSKSVDVFEIGKPVVDDLNNMYM